nr:TylF/MycF family methyltransferase [Cohnella sp. CFH 77786]
MELLIKTILYEIWLEEAEYKPIDQAALPPDILEYTKNHGFEVVQRFQPNKEVRRKGGDWPLVAHSMIGRLRMENLLSCMKSVVNDHIEGDFIETGVWRGGSCIFMRGFLKAYGIDNRRVWVADSFEGLPKPDPAKYPVDAGDTFYQFDYLRVSLEQVQENFRKYDLLDEQVKFLKGWFKDTLPAAPIDQIAILRADGDLYESTMDCLNNLYDKVTPGGFVIIDDYGLRTCKEAVDDFRREHNIQEPMVTIDWTGVYWRKNKS